MKLLHEPLVHFLVIGVALFVIYAYWGQPVGEEQGKSITITTGEITWLTDTWEKRWTRPPTPEERQGLIDQYLRELILYREAVAMGLDRNDSVIRRRMAQKLEFLAEDLVTIMPPTDEDLQAYFAEHLQRYKEPELFTFTQVFIDPDKRGDATLDDAKKIKAALDAQTDAINNTAALGDDFMLHNYYPENSQADIQKLFGSGFAESLVKLSTDQWHGPVLSGYGVHLVHVHSRIEPPEPEFAKVRERVELDWETDKREELNEKFYTSLRDRYTIVIEEVTEDNEVAAVQTVEEETP
jgi:peptidyl-prolyl cis-trans isomerase C